MRKVLLITMLLAVACTGEEITDRKYPRFYPLKVEGVTRTTADLSVEIFYSSVPILDHGFLYSTVGYPNVSEGTKVSLGARSGAGTYSHTLTGLAPNRIYYVRAYTISDKNTVYSTGVKFTTIH